MIAPDLRGFGDTAKPETGYDKKTMAQDVHALGSSLGIEKAGIVGHDIGLMVAYAYAAQYPAEVDRLALLDAFIPGVGDTTNLFLLKDLWHFHFYGPTPLALVKGRERIYFEHFWNDFAADPREVGVRIGPPVLLAEVRAARCNEGRHGGIPRVRPGCEGQRRIRQNQAGDAHASARAARSRVAISRSRRAGSSPATSTASSSPDPGTGSSTRRQAR